MTTLADRYELEELLGSGGMARVHAAVDRRLGRRVAVKVVREDLVADGRSRERLIRAAQSAASFHHPNSVAVCDVGEHERQPFIVMELIEGESLAERLGREGRLAPEEVVRIGGGVLAALEVAHERGLVHRDIKPANVLLPRKGGVKLADFGIAKAVANTAGGLTAVGDVMGTPNYLSPEQAAGRSATPASDLYALGVVLYECLAGEPPFSGENPLAVALAHQRDPAPPLRRTAREVPEALAAVVERALAKDPAERFTDAAQMRRALEAAASGEAVAPTVALGDSAAYAETTVVPAGDTVAERPYPATEVLPGEPDEPAAAEEREPPRRRRGLLVLLGVLVALALAAALALALFDGEPEEEPVDEPIDEPIDEPADEPPADEPPAEPAPEEPPAEEPPAEEEPPEDAPPADPPPEEPAPDDPPADSPQANDPPGDSPAEDNPPDDTPAGDQTGGDLPAGGDEPADV